MYAPEHDLAARTVVWNQLQMLYMDTDVAQEYAEIARICAESAYSESELEDILFNEVLPAVGFNMFCLPAPEWTGFDRKWLQKRVLQKHRFGKRRPLILRRYTRKHWRNLRRVIAAYRKQPGIDTD